MSFSKLKFRIALLGLNYEQLTIIIPSVISAIIFIFAILNKSFSLLQLLIICLLVALTPYSFYVTVAERRKFRYEREFADFLFELSELVRGGIDPLRAIKVLSERELGSITKFVKIIAKQTELGFSFEFAMRNLANLLKSSLIANYAELVVQASYTGGSISSLIQKASMDMKTIIAIEEEKRAGLRQYMVILYFAHFILLAIGLTIVIQFLPGLMQIGSFGISTPFGLISQADLNFSKVSESLIHLIVLNAFFGGLMVGKISSSSIRQGLKHSLILVVASYVVWNFFAVDVGEGFEIEIVSKPESLYIGLPSEITVKVVDTKGEPVKDKAVVFSINKGKVVPETNLTDTNGLCSTKVIAEGEEEGFYEITVKTSNAVKRIVLPATLI
ncbi:MAG: type II secretion system F family protein [Archaeoglobaceae archaeon]